MNVELKNDLIASRTEIQLVLDEYRVSNVKDMQQRLEWALHWLDKYITDDDVISEVK